MKTERAYNGSITIKYEERRYVPEHQNNAATEPMQKKNLRLFLKIDENLRPSPDNRQRQRMPYKQVRQMEKAGKEKNQHIQQDREEKTP